MPPMHLTTFSEALLFVATGLAKSLKDQEHVLLPV